MGSRGAFIVAAKLQSVFAALLPLSPHHEPYSYVPLAPDVSHLPIWLSHGDVDRISSYSVALEMKEALLREGATNETFIFTSQKGVGHWGWADLYSKPDMIVWLLSHRRKIPAQTNAATSS